MKQNQNQNYIPRWMRACNIETPCIIFLLCFNLRLVWSICKILFYRHTSISCIQNYAYQVLYTFSLSTYCTHHNVHSFVQLHCYQRCKCISLQCLFTTKSGNSLFPPHVYLETELSLAFKTIKVESQGATKMSSMPMSV